MSEIADFFRRLLCIRRPDTVSEDGDGESRRPLMAEEKLKDEMLPRGDHIVVEPTAADTIEHIGNVAGQDTGTVEEHETVVSPTKPPRMPGSDHEASENAPPEDPAPLIDIREVAGTEQTDAVAKETGAELNESVLTETGLTESGLTDTDKNEVERTETEKMETDKIETVTTEPEKTESVQSQNSEAAPMSSPEKEKPAKEEESDDDEEEEVCGVTPLSDVRPLSVTLKKDDLALKKLSFFFGDITKLKVDVIVNAANKELSGGGGVDGAIHSAAGYTALQRECQKQKTPVQPGGVAATSSCGIRHVKRIYHAVGPIARYSKYSPDELEAQLVSCYMTSLQMAVEEGHRTIAFPCISTGIYGYPNVEAAYSVLKAVTTYLNVQENNDKFDRVVFVLFMDKDKECYKHFILEYVKDPACFTAQDEDEKAEGANRKRAGADEAESSDEETDNDDEEAAEVEERKEERRSRKRHLVEDDAIEEEDEVPVKKEEHDDEETTDVA